MDYYDKLKQKNDILSVAFSLGYDGKKSSSSYQGDCPKHGSSGGKCLVIWPGIQGFRCYHCGETGDVIDLVMLFKRWDHKTARDFLADRAGMLHLSDQNLSLEDLEKRESEVQEKMLVEEVLTEATRWYHQQLQAYPDILNHLLTHYGFSQESIDELQIGFAPPPTNNGFSELAEHLSSNPNWKDKLALSGLFTFVNPSGPLYDYFKGRIIFPYWKAGKVLYMAGRATTLTPRDPYECYTKDGNIKKDEQGNPIFIKYKKLRNHDPEDERKKFISRFIQNDVFLGEDTVYGKKEIVITEGFPDWVSALDKGFSAISPATTNFREQDLKKLGDLTMNAETVYIINDNEENQAGLDGAMRSAKYLTNQGRNVFIIKLPRPEGKTKIDLNEYFLDHTADELKKLMNEAKSYLGILIDSLPTDYIKAQPSIKSDIAPILLRLDKGPCEHFLDLIRKRTKTSLKAINADIEAAREEEELREFQRKEETVDPEVENMAKEMALDPSAFKKRLDIVNQAGVVGERETISMYFVDLDSRLLESNDGSPNTLALKNAGHFGAGKSFTLMKCLEIYPESCYKLITNGSAKSIYYLKEDGLKHKAFIVTEGFQFQANNAGDSELVYATRSLISEGKLRYTTVEKDDKGNLITREKAIDGPTSFITTTIMESLEAQLEDRLFTIHPDESFEQTRRIIQKIGQTKAGKIPPLDKKLVAAWKLFHKTLKPVHVVIPFAEDIARFITKQEDIPIATRRAFNRVMIVIQAVVCFYQRLRKRDDQGRVIADISDYWVALQIVDEAFRENMGDQSKKTEDRLKVVMNQGLILPKDLAKKLGLSGTTISDWSKKKIQEGTLVWCDEYGQPFLDEKDLRKAKHSGKAYLKVSDAYTRPNVAGLPTPFELTKDNRWNEGGELLLEYDLDLEVKPKADEVIGGVWEVFGSPQNTPASMEAIQNIEDSDDEEEGVRVLVPEGRGINQSANKEINFDNLIF